MLNLLYDLSVALASLEWKVVFTCKLSTLKTRGSEQKQNQDHILTMKNLSIISDLIKHCTVQNFRSRCLLGWLSWLGTQTGSRFWFCPLLLLWFLWHYDSNNNNEETSWRDFFCSLSLEQPAICLFYRMKLSDGAGIATQDTEQEDSLILRLPCSCISSRAMYNPSYRVQNRLIPLDWITLPVWNHNYQGHVCPVLGPSG